MDLTHDMIDMEQNELWAVREAALLPEQCPVTALVREEVATILKGMTLKSITASKTGGTISIKFNTPALGKGRVLEATMSSWRNDGSYTFLEVMGPLHRAFSLAAFRRNLPEGASSSVTSWQDSVWTTKSWGSNWSRAMWNLVAHESGARENKKHPMPIQGTTTFAVAMEDLGLIGVIVETMETLNKSNAAQANRLKHEIQMRIGRLQPELRQLLFLGVDHEQLKAMIDDEIVKLVQES